MTHNNLKNTKRWVVKVGSSLVTADGKGLDLDAISQWGEQLAALHNSGCEIILVSSGAIAEGMSRLGWTTRPNSVNKQQAAAAVGQMGLVQAYESHFKRHDINTAQVLLTHADLANRQRYLNARNTFRTLLDLGVIPIINENDTVTTDEIKFGDNDTLGALVANLVEADLLVILTDQQGLYDSDPRTNSDAQLITQAPAHKPELLGMAGPSGTHIGSGGMTTKITAARRAAKSGTHTIIASGHEANVLPRLKNGETIGSLLTAEQPRLVARKRWLANQLIVQGTLTIDHGAAKVLSESGSSLLPVGLTAVEGAFQRGELVACIDPNGREVAKGLVNYNADEARKLIRKPSNEIKSILGYVDNPELIHRDNMIII